MRARRLQFFLCLTPAVLWLGLLIVLPHIGVVFESFSVRAGPGEYRTGTENYAEILAEPFYWRTLMRTLGMSILVTAITLALAFPIAYFMAVKSDAKTRGLLLLACLFPFWVSELVRLLGWTIILRQTGLLNTALLDLGLIPAPLRILYTDSAVTLGLVYSGLLFMIVPLVNALETLDRSLIEAGRDLGASGLTIQRRIVVPHAMPGIVAGSILVFMATVGNYATAVLLGGKNALWFTEQIYLQFITRFNWPIGSALGLLLLVCSSLVVWFALRLSGQRLAAAMRQS
jgi:spermidine/putrescine transport system permease protein